MKAGSTVSERLLCLCVILEPDVHMQEVRKDWGYKVRTLRIDQGTSASAGLQEDGLKSLSVPVASGLGGVSILQNLGPFITGLSTHTCSKSQVS